MKTLSFARPLLLMVIGLPGAGKSFFAQQFANTFNAPLISVDRLRFELFANPTYSSQEQDIIKRLVNCQLQELLKTQSTIVIDGNCNSAAERKQLATAVKKRGYEYLVVWVQTDEATARHRSLRRKPNPAEGAYSYSLNDEQFTTLAKRLTQPQREQYVVISGKHSYSTQAKMVLRKLALPRSTGVQDTPRQTSPPGRTAQPPRRTVKIIR